jgi:acetyltransferase-like isoleucine patch superfamily enzyme
MSPPLVIPGKFWTLDEGVILGYPTGRPIKPHPLRLGDHAHVRSNTVIYCNSVIGEHLETGHNVVIREENQIGAHLSIWNNSCIDYGCVIGANVRIHNNCYICQFTTIEDDVFIAPGVITANDPYPICTQCMKGPTLKKGCRIGANVTLLPHITVGEGALVGAGSVVCEDIPPHTLAYGAPARPGKDVGELKCRFGGCVPYVDGKDIRTRQLESQARNPPGQ